MRTSTKRILSILIAALFIIGTLLVYLNLIPPEAQEIAARRAIVASKEAAFRNQEQAVGQVQDLIGQFKNIATLQETVALAMPNDPATIGALRQIEAIARTSGVSLVGLDFKVIAPRSAANQSFIKKLGTVEIDVNAEGTYEGLKRFLQLFETSVRVTNVKEFKFEPAGSRAGATSGLVVAAEVYYQE